MKSNILKATIWSAIVILAGEAGAQDYPTTGPVRSPHWFQHHASTVYEGWLRGRADLTRARGEYNYNSSLANVYNQEARGRQLDNDKKRVETYFQMRQINREARNAERRPHPTREELAENAHRLAPRRLTAYQYERALGSVVWPAVLQAEEFEEERAAVDQLIAQRTTNNSGAGTNNHRLIKQLTNNLQEQLKERIDSLSPTEYVNAKKFLTSLEYESQHRLDADGLAASQN